MSGQTNEAQAQAERVAATLDETIRPYLKKGWVIQSISARRAQLVYTKKHGCLWKLTFGLFLWWLFPSKSVVLNIEIFPNGQVHLFKVKR